MADRGRRKRAKEAISASSGMSPSDPLTKEQKKVTHWLRRNVPTKKTKFLHSHVVEYFVASKAIDSLLNDSPWALPKDRNNQQQAKPSTANSSGGPVFASREQCVTYMDELLRHKMFHRAKKIPVADKKAKKDEAEDKTKKDEQESSSVEKKKRKIRLDMHLDQLFVDGNDAYVWLYDPVSWVYWLGGTAIVLATIGVCMFPLWPPIMRTGVHYLSIGAAGFLLVIMGLAAFKYVLFAALFVLSGGKLSFWLFPNLTEDVGFLESFMPVYDYTYTGRSFRRKKEKDSDDEESDDEEEGEEGNEENKKGEDESESDDSNSKRSSTGKDFELVERDDEEEES